MKFNDSKFKSFKKISILCRLFFILCLLFYYFTDNQPITPPPKLFGGGQLSLVFACKGKYNF